MSSSTGPKAAKGFFVNIGSLVSARAFLALSQIIVLPIVARQLTIEEFALMAMAMTVVIFTQVLSDAGLGRSLIRAMDYDLEEWSTVFWLLVAVGVGLAAVILAVAPLWAAFFDQPKLAGILMALAIVPLCQALSAAPNAEIERRENYTGIAKVQMITTVISLGLAVLLALAGAGVWALVAQQLALAVIRLAGILWLSEFRPLFTFNPARIGRHLVFARDAIIVSLIGAARGQAAVVAIGKILGEGALGLFSMSERFSRMPQYGLAGPASTVVYVRMAKAQDNPERLVQIYLASLRLLAAILFPILAMIAVAGGAIFTVFLSDTWAEVAPVFALSITGLAIEAVSLVCIASLFRAVGRTELQVRLAFEGALLRVILVVGAAFISLEAVATALTVWGVLLVPRGWMLAQRVVPLDMRACCRALTVPIAVSAVFVTLHVILRSLYAPGHWTESAMAIALSLAALALTALIDRKNLRAAIQFFKS
ncbi:oligosaccharide flippase family protein [Actibacterium sp. 188UL27-1]|uniref:oligosaccharide flippase family protein n=1 Tax=Actibacterium sp. 188UL27-1 TaxID=2786961 RepID=UPI00195CC8B0|nr:oligosaccharide flippase family protein [Actibacterium sp. 188UL27-1]MBM7066660.1 oligosaccharide flippase family protein [Actibacterium sp. 188UL27-1]